MKGVKRIEETLRERKKRRTAVGKGKKRRYSMGEKEEKEAVEEGKTQRRRWGTERSGGRNNTRGKN